MKKELNIKQYFKASNELELDTICKHISRAIVTVNGYEIIVASFNGDAITCELSQLIQIYSDSSNLRINLNKDSHIVSFVNEENLCISIVDTRNKGYLIDLFFDCLPSELIINNQTEKQASFLFHLKDAVLQTSRMLEEGRSKDYIDAMRPTLFSDANDLAEEVIDDILFEKGFKSKQSFYDMFNNKEGARIEIEYNGWKLMLCNEKQHGAIFLNGILSTLDNDGKQYGVNVSVFMQRKADEINREINF